MSEPTTPSAPTSAPTADPAVEALQVALAAEHAAVFVYAALGAQTSRSAAPTLFDRVTRAYRVHVGRRDRLLGRIGPCGLRRPMWVGVGGGSRRFGGAGHGGSSFSWAFELNALLSQGFLLARC